jgi:hypothetical protein
VGRGIASRVLAAAVAVCAVTYGCTTGTSKCLNPQPLPPYCDNAGPADNVGSNGGDDAAPTGGGSFSTADGGVLLGADAGAAEPPASTLPGDAGLDANVPDAAVSSDSGTDSAATDASDAAYEGGFVDASDAGTSGDSSD